MFVPCPLGFIIRQVSGPQHVLIRCGVRLRASRLRARCSCGGSPRGPQISKKGCRRHQQTILLRSVPCSWGREPKLLRTEWSTVYRLGGREYRGTVDHSDFLHILSHKMEKRRPSCQGTGRIGRPPQGVRYSSITSSRSHRLALARLRLQMTGGDRMVTQLLSAAGGGRVQARSWLQFGGLRLERKRNG